MTTATFQITLTPAEPELEGTGRFDFTKTWSGDMAGTSAGVMLSAGDPASGDAGYVALERFEGTIDGAEGTLVFQQFGMSGATDDFRYEIVPGSGTGALAGLGGRVVITIAEDGTHTVVLER